MWGGVDLGDGLTASILFVGRWALSVIGFILIAWGTFNFMKNLLLALLGKKIKTGIGEVKFLYYILIFIVGVICTGAILGGSYMQFLNKMYQFLVHLKSQMNL